MQKHRKFNHLLGAAALSMLFGTSPLMAQAGGDRGSSSDAGKTGQSSGASKSTSQSASGSEVAQSDQKMMREIAQANLAEIATAKLAQEKSKNEDVQAFARRMIDDHSDAQAQLQDLAEQKGVELPTEPDKQHQAAMKKMASLSADQFDKRYLTQGGLRDHRQTQKLLSRVEQQAKDEDLRELARNLLPTITEHLATAKEVHEEQMTTSGGAAGDVSSKDSGQSSVTTGAESVTGTSGSSNSMGPGK